ncbi:MAG TPA: dihydroneopterin aldolase [Acidimicrobiales bacterium]|nr:dihydroneopterin aldolase [Acidimicrobiales bacterium]
MAGPGPGDGDRIEIRGLRVEAVHGVLPSEREAAQPFEVDLDVYLDLAPAAGSDVLDDSADYAAAVGAAVGVLAGPPRQLLEALAEDIATAVLADGKVTAVTVAVRKLRPPVPEALASAGVRLHRVRG